MDEQSENQPPGDANDVDRQPVLDRATLMYLNGTKHRVRRDTDPRILREQGPSRFPYVGRWT